MNAEENSGLSPEPQEPSEPAPHDSETLHGGDFESGSGVFSENIEMAPA
jgi:hypothetical protein